MVSAACAWVGCTENLIKFIWPSVPNQQLTEDVLAVDAVQTKGSDVLEPHSSPRSLSILVVPARVQLSRHLRDFEVDLEGRPAVLRNIDAHLVDFRVVEIRPVAEEVGQRCELRISIMGDARGFSVR